MTEKEPSSSDPPSVVRPQSSVNSPALWLAQFPVPKRDGNKYDRGHALIYGGAVMTGAARLAARAAQRIGAGLVTIVTPAKAVPIYAEALESVIVRVADTAESWREQLNDPKKNAILIGPGLGIGAAEAELVLAALATRKICVVDADAFTNFATDPNRLFSSLHDQCILTPHEGEFARVFGSKIDPNADKLSRTRKAAEIAKCIVLLKGAETVIAAPNGDTIVNTNAPPYLATGGSGDVLAGMILGLAAQGMPVFMAAAAAAWLHGQIASDFGPGLIAEDLVAQLPAALRWVYEQKQP